MTALVPDRAATEVAAERIEVFGVVQGVGFRPFVHRTATGLGLDGRVGNDAISVFIEVTGSKAKIDALVDAIGDDPPPLARVDRVTRTALLDGDSASRGSGFSIVTSRDAAGSVTLVPPDTALCTDCRTELFDPANRRYRHPFITCTNCGPRFTIIEAMPYDRPATTMAPFELCGPCRREYEDPGDRRYHAQPIGCHDCGPTLELRHDQQTTSGDRAIEVAAELLGDGAVVAVKGLGGYHLACSAVDGDAISRLRGAKHRPDKALAVMVADLAAAARLATIEPEEAALLTSAAAPIVLVRARADTPLAASVAPGNPLVGIMLAYTPLHQLLLAAVGGPLVMTSANRGGQPIATDRATIDHLTATDDPAHTPLADGVLDHDRRIATPCDDSVVRVIGGRLVPIRRARGYAPVPVPVAGGAPVLAVGGELKNTFCLTGGGQGWLSQHIGDMENLETLDAFEQTVDRLGALYRLAPETIVIDRHPGYLTGSWARRQRKLPIVEVQHHHAHIAAVMAEHGIDPERQVLGFAFDGTGYGSDGTIWGGELLVADGATFERVAHLAPVPLPGGDAAVTNPHRVALAHLAAAGIEWERAPAPLGVLSATERQLLARQIERSVACVATTSMGRLFDAVAAILGVRQRISYEAQAVIELEILAAGSPVAARNDGGPYRFGTDDGPIIDQGPVLAAIVDDLEAGADGATIAWRFHAAVADAVAALAERERSRRGLTTAVLGGGVFQNALATELCIDRLERSGFEVLTASLVPPNDGGLAIGQAYVAAALQAGPANPTRDREQDRDRDREEER